MFMTLRLVAKVLLRLLEWELYELTLEVTD